MRILRLISLLFLSLLIVLTTLPTLAELTPLADFPPVPSFKDLGWESENTVVDILENEAGSKILAVKSRLMETARGFGFKPYTNSPLSKKDNVFQLHSNGKNTNDINPCKDLQPFVICGSNIILNSLDKFTTQSQSIFDADFDAESINFNPSSENTKGEGIKIAVIDTGIDDSSSDEETVGYNFIDNHEIQPSEVDGDDSKSDHGTRVAKIINRIAPKAELMPIKALDKDGRGTLADVTQAINFAVSEKADVINLSLGYDGDDSPVLKQAIQEASNRGVVVVAAAGYQFPASYSEVIGITTTTLETSDIREWVDLTVPVNHSTSIAAAHVAGVAALLRAQLKAQNINDPGVIAKILKEAAKHNNSANNYGTYPLDADEAIKMASNYKNRQWDWVGETFAWLASQLPEFRFENVYYNLLGKRVWISLFVYLLFRRVRKKLPFRWNLSFYIGLIFGSVGIFFLQGFKGSLVGQVLNIVGQSIPDLSLLLREAISSWLNQLAYWLEDGGLLGFIASSLYSVANIVYIHGFFVIPLIALLLIAFLPEDPKLQWFTSGCILGMAYWFASQFILITVLLLSDFMHLDFIHSPLQYLLQSPREENWWDWGLFVIYGLFCYWLASTVWTAQEK